MPKRVYVGPVDVIETTVDGRKVKVRRGETVECSAAAAKRFDAQPSNWANEPKAEVKEPADVAE